MLPPLIDDQDCIEQSADEVVCTRIEMSCERECSEEDCERPERPEPPHVGVQVGRAKRRAVYQVTGRAWLCT